MSGARRHEIGTRWLFVSLVAVLAGAGLQGRIPGEPPLNDPPRYRFVVAFEGRELGTFQKVSGLTHELEVIEFRDGNDAGTVRYVPGRTKFSPIRLERVFTGDMALYDWLTSFASTLDRTNGTIVLYEQRHEVARWNFVNAWPSKYTGPTLTAERQDVATETLEIVHEGFLVERPTRP